MTGINSTADMRRYLETYDGPAVRIMEVCGTHTHEIFRQGIRKFLSPKINLISGPGCPVCVTPAAYIDEAVYLADKVVVMTPRPAKIEQVLDVKLSQPRDRNNPEFIRLRSEILRILDFAGKEQEPEYTI